MTLLSRILAGLLGCSAVLWAPPACAETTVVIVRHGEKPPRGLGQLSCQGLNRALALPGVLLARYGNPVAIYAPNPAIKKKDKGVPYAYVRPLATIEPLAIRAGQPVNVDWGMEDVQQLAKQLLAQRGGTIVVAWEHHYGEKLAKELLIAAGGNPSEVPAWDDADFDGIFVVRIAGSQQGKARATFAREAEGLNDLPQTCGH